MWQSMNRTKGFTLIELLVAMAVLTLLTVLLMGIMSQMVRLSQSTQSRAERLEKAGTALEMITRDLTAAIMPVDPTRSDTLQLKLNPPELEGLYQSPGAIFFQAPLAANQSQGDIAEIGYFIKWSSPPGETPNAKLCRFSVDPADSDSYLIESGQPWITASLLEQKAGGDVPGYDGLVSEGVIALWIRCLDAEGHYHYTWNSRSQSPKRLPVAIEIALVVIDNRTAVKLESIPTFRPTTADKFEEDISFFLNNLPNSIKTGAMVFRTTIPIVSGSVY